MDANHEGAIEHAIRKQHEWGRAKGTKHGDGTICGGNGDEMGTQGDRQRFLGAMRKKGGAGMQQPPCSDGGARQWRRTGQPRAGHGGETAAVRPQKPTNSHKGVVRLPGQHPSLAAVRQRRRGDTETRAKVCDVRRRGRAGEQRETRERKADTKMSENALRRAPRHHGYGKRTRRHARETHGR